MWGMDLPGHGTAVGVQLPNTSCSKSTANSSTTSTASSSTTNSSALGGGNSTSSTTSSSFVPISFPGLTQYVIDAIKQAGLAGCYAFGHSVGGAVALAAASQYPGLFKAMYCFEAVASTPATHAFMAEAAGSGAIQTDGQKLGLMARKRRAVFDSRAAARQQLTSKPPFSGLHPQAMALYLQHGLVERPTAAATLQLSASAGRQQGGPEQPASPRQQQQAHQQQQAQQQDGRQQAVQLVCSPEQEAAYYEALQTPPAVDVHSIHCPCMIAVAAPAPASGDPPAANLATHAGVRAWFTARSSGQNGGGQLHGELRVLNIELAAAMPTGQLQEVVGVSHLGPLEQPLELADSIASFFKVVAHHSTQQRSKL